MGYYKNLEYFNTHSMSKEAVLSLLTGREKIIDSINKTIKNNLNSAPIQHILLTGVRGMGKSYILRYFQIILAENKQKDTLIEYILFPEEQRNIKAPSTLIYEILNKMEGVKEKNSLGSFNFNENNNEWETAVSKLNKKIEENKEKFKNYLLIIAIENIDIMLESAFIKDKDNSKFRKLLSDTSNFMVLGASLKFDIDSKSNKRLYMAFQKMELLPWAENDFVEFFHKRLEYAQKDMPEKYNKEEINDLQHKIKSISVFSGGSPRIASVLVNLIFDDDIISVLDMLEKLIEQFTDYYRSILDRLPPKSEFLLDVFIKKGENLSQSELADIVNSKQSDISQAFKELERQYIIKKNIIKGEKSLKYFVADRIMVLFYYKRYIDTNLGDNRLNIFSSFLVDFYKEEELKNKITEKYKINKREDAFKLASLVLNINSEMQEMQDLPENTFINLINNMQIKNEKEYFSQQIKEGVKIKFEDIESIEYAEKIKDLDKLDAKELENEYKKEKQKIIEKKDLFGIISGEDFVKLVERSLFFDKIQKLKVFKSFDNFDKSKINQLINLFNEEKEKFKEFEKEFPENVKKFKEKNKQPFEILLLGEKINSKAGKIKDIRDVTELEVLINQTKKYQSNIYIKNEIAKGFEKIATYYDENKEYKKVIEYYEKALVINKEAENKDGQVLNLGQIGWNYTDLKEYEKAIEYHNKALEISKEINEKNYQAWNLGLIGLNFSFIKNYEKAIEYNNKSLEISKEIDNKNIQALSLKQICLFFKELKNFEKAIEYHKKALEIYKEINDKNEQAWNLEQIGWNFRKLKSYEKGIEFHKKALEIREETKDKDNQAENLEEIGWNYKELKEFEKAIEYHKKALVLSKETNNKDKQAWDLGHIIECLLYSNPSEAWNIFSDEKYKDIPKNEIVREIADAVIFKERWDGIVSGFKMAKLILTKLKELLSEDEFFECIKSFFAGLMNMNISEELLYDIATEFKTGTIREQIISEAVIACIGYRKSNDKETFLLKQNPDLRNLIKAIVKEGAF